jgi:hypothetical protein
MRPLPRPLRWASCTSARAIAGQRLRGPLEPAGLERNLRASVKRPPSPTTVKDATLRPP